MARIHPTGLVDPGAELAEDVEIGPYAIVGPHVRIGAGSRVGPHAVVTGHTSIGRDNRIFQFASVGEAPQDKKYAGEPTRLEIGDRNTGEYYSMYLGLVLGIVLGGSAVETTGEQGSMVWIQRLDSLTASALPGTEGATMVFWSPDGELLVYLSKPRKSSITRCWAATPGCTSTAASARMRSLAWAASCCRTFRPM